MPTLTRWFLRAGMVYFLAAVLMGLVLTTPVVRSGQSVVAVFGPTQLHLFTVGWITQVIFGVAYWMFPRHSAARPRGSEVTGWTSLVLLNAGLLLRVVGEPLSRLGSPVGPLLVVSALLQLVAGWAFVLNTWPRVRGR